MTAPRFANRELLTSAKLNLLSDTADLGETHAARTDNPHSTTTAQTNFTPAGTNAVVRTAQAKLRDLKAVADFATVTDANNAAGPKIVTTNAIATIGAGSLDGPYCGFGGQITDSSGNKRGPWFSALKAPPTQGDWSSVVTAFNGDLSTTPIAIERRVSGATTLTQPATGYAFTREASAIAAYGHNSSGWNEQTGGNDGRTAGAVINIKADNYGQGDYTALYCEAFVSGTKATATNFLANPAGCLMIGGVGAGSDGVYLNPFELNMTDNGHDAAGIAFVTNMRRSNATGAQGVAWGGFRGQSTGTQSIDFLASASGKYNVGVHLQGADFGTNQAAITLHADQRIYFAATCPDSTGFLTTTGNNYISYSSTLPGFLIVASNTAVLQIQGTQFTVTKPLVISSGGGANYLALPQGTTAQRVDGTGRLRYNTDLGRLEAYEGGAWGSYARLAGDAILGGTIDNAAIGNTTPAAGAFSALSVGGNAVAASVSSIINAAAGQLRGVRIQTAGSVRWVAGANGTSESGANAGSDFELRRYNDSGTYVESPILVSRSSGQVQLTQLITGPGIFNSTSGKVTIGASANSLAFFSATGAVKGTVSGSRGGNAALASLLTLLASYGLITDSTTV